jgi:hypothetical protein
MHLQYSAPPVHQYWTTGGEAAPDAGNGDAGEMRSLCIFLVLHRKKDTSDA